MWRIRTLIASSMRWPTPVDGSCWSGSAGARLRSASSGDRCRCRSPRSCSTCRSSRRAVWCGRGRSVAPAPAASTWQPCGRPSTGCRSAAVSSSGAWIGSATIWPGPPTGPRRATSPELTRRTHDRALRPARHVRDRARLPGARVPRVFAAFATKEAKEVWGDTGDLSEPGADAAEFEFDFRVGGHERFGFGYQGVSYRYDARYYEIAPGQRIIYSYEMYADGVRISVSVATIEFAPTADGTGTTLTWTEQGAFLDGFDGPDASSLRQGGTEEMLEGLANYLA